MMEDKNRKRKENDPSSLDEEPTASKTQKISSGKTDLFIDQLRLKYRKLYDAAQLLPYAKERLCSINELFTQGNIQRRSSDKRGNEIWQSLESYHDIFNKSSNESKRYFILGDPGYGKSTLSFQFLYDWCNQVQGSSLHGVDIVIFLQMKQLGGFTSIYQAIKQLLLPIDFSMTVDDIKGILEATESTMTFFDGFDEYPERGNANSGFNEILKAIPTKDTHVILTTTLANLEITPNELRTQATQFKLTGFTEEDQHGYIMKAVVSGDGEAARLIKDKLKGNPILDDMCQIPFFFTIAAHAVHDDKEIIPNTKSATCFVRFITECFSKQTRNKQDRSGVISETARDKLSKIAFEALNKQKIVWNDQLLVNEMGEIDYNALIHTGILAEEEESSQQLKSTSFSHKLFCESYAAFYLVDLIRSMIGEKNMESTTRKEISSSSWKDPTDLLSSFDQKDLQHLFRFASGLDVKAGVVIIEYLLTHTEDKDLAILCIFEFAGEDKDITDAVGKLTSRSVVFNNDDSKTLQRAKVRLLEIASRCNVPISDLSLCMTFGKVDDGDIVLKSGLRLPSLSSLLKITINAGKAELKEDDVIGLLNNGLKSQRFEDLWFESCELPDSFRVDDIPPSSLTRNIRVMRPDHASRFDLKSNTWTEVKEIEDIRRLCLQPVVLDDDMNMSVMETITEMLYTASDHPIPIACLHLRNSLASADDVEIQLTSDLYVTTLTNLERLIIEENGAMFDDDELVTDYIECAAVKVKELIYRLCLLPRHLSGSLLEVLKSREGRVLWEPYGNVGRSYELDLEKGHWLFRENHGSLFPSKSRGDILTNEEYQKEETAFKAIWYPSK